MVSVRERKTTAHWYDLPAVAAALLLIASAWSKGSTQGPSPAWTGPAGIAAILLIVVYVIVRRRAERR